MNNNPSFANGGGRSPNFSRAWNASLARHGGLGTFGRNARLADISLAGGRRGQTFLDPVLDPMTELALARGGRLGNRGVGGRFNPRFGNGNGTLGDYNPVPLAHFLETQGCGVLDCGQCGRGSGALQHHDHLGAGRYCPCGCNNPTHGDNATRSVKDNARDVGRTKDVTVRGKARQIRASYLAENSKFEKSLCGYLDDKKETEVPERVIDMLIAFINSEDYTNRSVVDEVTLNIVAFSVGARSVVEYSLNNLEAWSFERGGLNSKEICIMAATILKSGMVDDRLKKWLEKLLKRDGNVVMKRVMESDGWKTLCEDHPEVVIDIQVMIGVRQSVDAEDSGFAIL